MATSDFHTLPLNLSFEQLYAFSLSYFGCVFLQDNDYPILACLPKTLWHISKNKTYQRQLDFSYQCETCDTSPLENHPPLMPQRSDLDFTGFMGGYIAFFSYDYAANLSIQNHAALSPTALMGEYDLFFRKTNNIWQLYFSTELYNTLALNDFITQLHNIKNTHTAQKQLFQLSSKMQARWQKNEYQRAFTQVQDYLKAGDCYQVNLTQEFYSNIKTGRLAYLYSELTQLTQAPYAGYWSIDDFELLSCSPELFIEFQAQGKLVTRPIKGTLPRHNDPIQDDVQKNSLANSEKDRAENVMIVDLLRNDLGIYAKNDSVKVPKLFEIESFAQVHHLVSEVQATLKAGIHPLQVLAATLPGGSITGAPKIRAMQIIEELEGSPRGAYCGSLGYLNYDGTGRFNILIRTLQRYGDRLSVWAGGGITIASELESEYQECLDKVSAMLKLLDQYAIAEDSSGLNA